MKSKHAYYGGWDFGDRYWVEFTRLDFAKQLRIYRAAGFNCKKFYGHTIRITATNGKWMNINPLSK